MDFDPARIALFLDLDGTLIDIAETPEGVSVPEGLVALLERLVRRLGGALAIITGRRIEDVDRLLAPLRPIAAGVHGAELRLAGGGMVEAAAAPVPEGVVTAAHRIAGDDKRVRVEAKGGAVAVHFRACPEAGPRLAATLADVVEAHGDKLILRPGRMVIEIVPRTISKGGALEVLMGLAAFRGRRPLMIGDDVTDESALAAAVRLGGAGLKVAGEHFAAGDADFASTAAVRAFLAALTERAPA